MTVTITYGNYNTLTRTNVKNLSVNDKTISINYTDTSSVNAEASEQISTKELGSYTMSIQYTAPVVL